MGLEGHGSSEMDLSLGSKNKYKRMDHEDNGFDEDYDSQQHLRQLERSRTTRKYVFACSVFASLNSVLLGYGKLKSTSVLHFKISSFLIFMSNFDSLELTLVVHTQILVCFSWCMLCSVLFVS